MQRHARMTKLKSNDSGFTLVEVLVAIVILMVGLLGVMQSLNLAIATNLQNEMRTQGTMIGESQMAKIKSLPFARITAAEGVEKSHTVPVNMRSVIVDYTVTRKIDDISGTMKRVNVGVSWIHRGNNHDYVVSGVVAEPGVH